MFCIHSPFPRTNRRKLTSIDTVFALLRSVRAPSFGLNYTEGRGRRATQKGASLGGPSRLRNRNYLAVSSQNTNPHLVHSDHQSLKQSPSASSDSLSHNPPTHTTPAPQTLNKSTSRQALTFHSTCICGLHTQCIKQNKVPSPAHTQADETF